jgi:hypothetical protein
MKPAKTKSSKKDGKSKKSKKSGKMTQKTLDSLHEAINGLLEDYQKKKSQVNDFEGKARTREIRMPTELTNARNLTCRITE